MSEQVIELLVVIGLVAFGFLIAVLYYESVCDRDVYLRRPMRIARRLTRHRALHALTYILAIAIGPVVLVLVWLYLLVAALFVVGSVERAATTAFVAVAVIGGARLLAYVRQKTSHELAKAIPMSMAFLLLTGGALNLDEKVARLADNPAALDISVDMLSVLLGLEIGLRLLTDGSNALLGWIRRRRGVASEKGVIRSVGAAIRSPAAPLSAAIGEIGGAEE